MLLTFVLAAFLVPAEVAVRETEADALALVAWSEDHLAAAAVMWTAVNRARERGTFPYREVHRPGQYHGMARGDPRRRRREPGDLAVLAALRVLAERVLRGDVPDPTGGATHFHREGTPAPPWAPPPDRWTAAGRHSFYRPVGTINSARKQRTYARRGMASGGRSTYYSSMETRNVKRMSRGLADILERAAATGDHNSVVLRKAADLVARVLR